MLVTLLSLNLIWAWAYRGGSLFKQQSWGWLGKTRWLCLLATPLFMVLAFALAVPSLDWPLWLFLMGGFVSFFGAQADGWGRQMDLGKNDRPDDETGHELRSLIWKKKSSFARDLTGLYMRFAQFLLPALCFYFVNPWFILPSVSLFLVAPLCWVVEHKVYYSKGTVPGFPFVELLIGGMLAATTILAMAMQSITFGLGDG
mgnify:CR=1 FL=1